MHDNKRLIEEERSGDEKRQKNGAKALDVLFVTDMPVHVVLPCGDSKKMSQGFLMRTHGDNTESAREKIFYIVRDELGDDIDWWCRRVRH